MIAAARSSPPVDGWQEVFLAMLPAVRRRAWRAARLMPYARRRDFVADVVANVAVAVSRLSRRGKLDRAFVTPLTEYAIKQVRGGRRVGSRLNVRDVMSHYCRLRKGVRVYCFGTFGGIAEQWKESLLEDRRAGPAETAATRIDMADWLGSLPPRDRRIAKTLATGETTKATARQFGLSPGRISQVRKELETSWRSFQGEMPAGHERRRAA